MCLTLSPWRVINVKFPLQPHQKYYTISHSMKNSAFHSLDGRRLTLPILAYRYSCLSLGGCDLTIGGFKLQPPNGPEGKIPSMIFSKGIWFTRYIPVLFCNSIRFMILAKCPVTSRLGNLVSMWSGEVLLETSYTNQIWWAFRALNSWVVYNWPATWTVFFFLLTAHSFQYFHNFIIGESLSVSNEP